MPLLASSRLQRRERLRCANLLGDFDIVSIAPPHGLQAVDEHCESRALIWIQEDQHGRRVVVSLAASRDVI
jgi:hypothetical protein